MYRPPKHRVAHTYQILINYNRVDTCGHYAASEEPEFFSADLGSAFRSLRS